MQHGDLSAQVMPTILIVFETVLATPPADPGRKILSLSRRSGKRHYLPSQFSYDQLAEAALWRLALNADVNVEIVTFLGDQFAASFRKLMDESNYPARTIWAAPSPEALARQLAHMPHVLAVYDGDPRRQFTYGGRTRIVTSHNKEHLGTF